MEKQTFLDSLREKLVRLGVGEDESARYIKQFERYFNTLSDEEVSQQINGFDSMDAIARNIVNLIARKKSRAEEPFPDADLVAQATASFDPVPEEPQGSTTREFETAQSAEYGNEAAEDSSAEDDTEESRLSALGLDDDVTGEFELDFLRPQTGQFPAVGQNTSDGDTASDTEDFVFPVDGEFDTDAEPEPKTETTAAFSPVGKTEEKQTASPAKNAEIEAEAEAEPVTEQTTVATEPIGQSVNPEATRVDMPAVHQTAHPSPAQSAGAHAAPVPEEPEAVTTDFTLDDSMFEEYVPSCPMFWGLCAASAILWIPVLAAVALLYGLVYAVLGITIGALIAVLVSVIVFGAGCSLVGIIYGFTQLTVAAPIAWYEIGLALVVAGVSLALGVLLYNGAVRFMPWVIRRMNVFSRFSLRQLRRRITKLKKLCLTQGEKK